MDDFIIERNANVAGKNTVTEPITKKRALHPGLLHEIRRRLIDFFSGNSGPNQFADTVKNVTRGAACLPHLFNFFRRS